MSIFNLIPQYPISKRKIIGQGILSTDKDNLLFFEGNGDGNSRCLGELERFRVLIITSKGMLINGFEYIGIDKMGNKKYKYQEWYCTFLGENK